LRTVLTVTLQVFAISIVRYCMVLRFHLCFAGLFAGAQSIVLRRSELMQIDKKIGCEVASSTPFTAICV
jgi:hypothetical protein